MRLGIFPAAESLWAFLRSSASAVEGEIFVNSGLTYRFFGFDLGPVFALDGESMTSLFLESEST